MGDARQDVMEALRAEWRLDFRVAERVLAALGRGGGVSELVEAASADRNDVEDVLRRVEPWLHRDGQRYALDGALDDPGAARPLVDEPALVATMAEIAAGLPPSVWSLDHVPAKPETMAARARYLHERYALAGATVLCVGDHDLTSVALGLVEPDAEILVVDVDERVLAHIADVAADRRLAITTAFGDLRLGLPPSFAGRADLVFTDPPYSPDGVGLFLTRGLEGLYRSGHERVAFSYGFAGRQLTRGFRTQAVLHELRLVVETVLPGFNKFRGAEAIGAASDLYVCRPTRWTWPVIDRAPARQPRIYTRGVAAVESADAMLEPSVVDSVRRELGEVPAYVGAGWPPEVLGDRPAGDLGTWLDAPPPGPDQIVAVNLHPYFGATLPRVLLGTARSERAAVVAPTSDVRTLLISPLRTLLTTAADLDINEGTGEASIVHTRRRIDAPESATGQALAFLLAHPVTKLGNAWRDALIALTASRKTTMTKNEARALIRASGVPGLSLQLRLGELPLCALAQLVEALPKTVDAVADQ